VWPIPSEAVEAGGTGVDRGGGLLQRAADLVEFLLLVGEGVGQTSDRGYGQLEAITHW
jgi:hypothetical protein